MSKAEIGEFMLLLRGNDLLTQKVSQRSFVFDETKANDFLEAERMRISARGKKRVGSLEQEREIGELGWLRILTSDFRPLISVFHVSDDVRRSAGGRSACRPRR